LLRPESHLELTKLCANKVQTKQIAFHWNNSRQKLGLTSR